MPFHKVDTNAASAPTLQCCDCNKTCKTENGLQNHERAKVHGQYRRENTYSDPTICEDLTKFHDERADLLIGDRRKSKKIVEDVLKTILQYEENNGRFALEPDPAGSYVTALKIGKPDEFDYTVSLELNHSPILSKCPLQFELEDDIDDPIIPKDRRSMSADKSIVTGLKNSPKPIPHGYTCVKLRPSDKRRFKDSCHGAVLLPVKILSVFHEFVKEAVEYSEFDSRANVRVTNHAKGPAISITIHGVTLHRIFVDICLKISTRLSLEEFEWPRKATELWLSEDKIEEVTSKVVYVVPKGDKYWKISFADYENAILRDIDKHENSSESGVRKKCLKIAKKKLNLWISQSEAKALTGMSSYLLKTILLWLCEALPDDDDWIEDQLAARYLNFLDDLRLCLEKRCLKEYFDPCVNILEGKDDGCIMALIGRLEKEKEQCSEDE